MELNLKHKTYVEEIDNACLVCLKKEAVDSGMCEACFDKASEHQNEKNYKI